MRGFGPGQRGPRPSQACEARSIALSDETDSSLDALIDALV